MTKKWTFSILLALVVAVLLATYFSLNFHIKATCKELTENWLQTEAVNIQEGNLLSAVSKYQKALFSSNMVTGVAVVRENSSGKLTSLLKYGTMDLPQVLPNTIGQLTIVENGLFSYMTGFRLVNRADTAVFFSFYSSLGRYLLSINVAFLLLSFSIFWIAVKKGEKHHYAEKMRLIRAIVENLSSNEDKGMVNTQVKNSTFLGEWPELAQEALLLEDSFTKLSDLLVTKTRKEAIADTTVTIAHDLRSSLLAFEVIASAPPHEVIESQKNLRNSLNKIYSMIEALKSAELDHIIRPVLQPLSISMVIDQCQILAKKKGIELSAETLSELSVPCDLVKLERAVTNLLINAIEAARTTVHVRFIEEVTELKIQVIDDGLGIPHEIQKALFRRGASFGKAHGSGLGLAFVQQVALGHGGSINYRRIEETTIFELSLPFHRPPQSDISAASSEDLNPKLSPSDLRGILILLTNRDLFQQLEQLKGSIVDVVFKPSMDLVEIGHKHIGTLNLDRYSFIIVDTIAAFPKPIVTGQKVVLLSESLTLAEIRKKIEGIIYFEKSRA